MTPRTKFKIFICSLDRADEVLLANIKMECQRWPKSLQYWGGLEPSVAMVTELLSSHCGAHLEESYHKESNMVKNLLSLWHHHLANLHIYLKDLNISGTKRDI